MDSRTQISQYLVVRGAPILQPEIKAQWIGCGSEPPIEINRAQPVTEVVVSDSFHIAVDEDIGGLQPKKTLMLTV